ncbi:FAD-dependent oxidoreductase [Limnohabitans sp.]|jgi:fumarate reductase flavoprotein subunit|uniref:FAD-dependent oxidoreductase n=1 Tax=Limnohabitans sp. TaxID=1907725 RepID=UPI0037C0F0F4
MSAKLPKVCPAAELQAEEKTPVVIVGAGACGLTAALALHRLGVDCVVLERDAFAAGSTALSSGFVPAPCTQAQQSQGITDSAEAFAADIQAKAHGQAAPHLVQAYAQHIGPALDALANHHGLPWQVLDNFMYPGHSVHRMHAVPEKTGAGLMSRLQAAADAAGVVVLTQSQVTELWADRQQRIHGVGFVRPDGQVERLRCDVVLLACNGFGGAKSMVNELLPEMAEATYAGHVGNDGSAIAWGRQLGARLADLGAYQGHGSWAVPQGALISWALMMEGGVQINAHGERFHNETRGYSEAAVQVLAQPGGVAWNVFDDALLAFAQDFPDFVSAQNAGAVQHAADAAALAQLIGCSLGTLQATLSAIRPMTDKATGRSFKRALQAPFHAIKVTGALFHTQGGLDIDAQARVLREDGTPLPNLLAAGGAARGVSGQAVWGYLSGNGLLSAIAGGHIAAQTAQQLLKDAAL